MFQGEVGGAAESVVAVHRVITGPSKAIYSLIQTPYGYVLDYGAGVLPTGK